MDTELYVFLSLLNFLSSGLNFNPDSFTLKKAWVFSFPSSKACNSHAQSAFSMSSPTACPVRVDIPHLCGNPLNPTQTQFSLNNHRPSPRGSLKNSYLFKHKKIRDYADSNQRFQRFSKTAAIPNTLFCLSQKYTCHIMLSGLGFRKYMYSD